MHHVNRRTPMPNCDFNKVAKQLDIFRKRFSKSSSGGRCFFLLHKMKVAIFSIKIQRTLKPMKMKQGALKQLESFCSSKEHLIDIERTIPKFINLMKETCGMKWQDQKLTIRLLWTGLYKPKYKPAEYCLKKRPLTFLIAKHRLPAFKKENIVFLSFPDHPYKICKTTFHHYFKQD